MRFLGILGCLDMISQFVRSRCGSISLIGMVQKSNDLLKYNQKIMSNFLSHIPENPTKNSKCIIMLHGVGSNQDDLFGLASNFSADIYIFSLQGIFSLGAGRYAWYPVDFSTGKPLYKTEDVEK